MGKIRSTLDGATKQFIQAPAMFFVASAPLDANGHVNVSPKGLDSLRILGPGSVACLDLTGSGVETVAHIKEEWPRGLDVLRVSGCAEHLAAARPGTRARTARA